MLGVCLTVGGALFAALPTAEVALTYRHSLYGAPVFERYRVTRQALVLTHYDSSAAVLEYYGMDPRPNTPYPEVRFLPDDVGEHALVWPGGRLDLSKETAPARLRPCDVTVQKGAP